MLPFAFLFAWRVRFCALVFPFLFPFPVFSCCFCLLSWLLCVIILCVILLVSSRPTGGRSEAAGARGGGGRSLRLAAPRRDHGR
eukprot:3012028-Rhodomonas_salina.1